MKHLSLIKRSCVAAGVASLTLLPSNAAPIPKPALQAFSLSSVQLGNGICSDEMLADDHYLHQLDADRLLYNFRKNAGLAAPGKPLGGWEAPDCELRGHFVGHYLSACALMYKSHGDKALRAKANYIVAELAKCQTALGGEYLSAFPTTFFDRVEARQPVWAPYYTIHKIMNGLFDVYQYCGNKQALDVAERMANYFETRTDKLSDSQFNAMLGTEFGGMANVLYDLYSVNHRPADLALAHRFDQKSFLEPLESDVDDLTNIHANTHVPKILGAARRYELLGDAPYGKLTSYFWDRVADHRSYATGGSNERESWGPPDKLANTLLKGWGANQETCTTYNMLKVTRDLIRWTGAPKYADFYERAFWNGIVEAQDRNNGMIIYYTPLAADAVKQWGTPNDSFWCCTGTGVESFAKLNDSIYFHNADSVYVNLYVASSVRWDAKHLTVDQVTNFPIEQGSTFVIHTAHPAKFALKLHIPLWVGSRCAINVNGKRTTEAPKPGTYASLDRVWHNGDRVSIKLPMEFHSQPMPDDNNVRAMMYGPLVLVGVTDQTTPINPIDPSTGLWQTVSPDPAQDLAPVPGKPLTFEATLSGHRTTFVPLFNVIDQAYTTYWTIDRPGSSLNAQVAAFNAAESARRARIIDSVQPNDPTSERLHNLLGSVTHSGTVGQYGWRDSSDWFEWTLKSVPNAANFLQVSYWGSDTGRTFDVLVNGTKLVTETLTASKPNELLTVIYPVPTAITGKLDSMTVRFVAKPGSLAGGVLGCATLKSLN